MDKQIKLVAKHTFFTRLKKKSFWWVLFGPVALIVFSAAIGWGVSVFSSNKTADVAVVAPAEVRTAIKENQKHLNIQVKSEKTESSAKKSLNKGELDGVLIINNDKGTILTQPKSNSIDTDKLKSFLSKQILADKAAKYNLTSQQIADLKNPFSLSSKVVDKNEKKDSEAADAVKQILTMAIGILVFIIVSTYSSIIGNEIANEKSSRIMETLLAASSAKAQYFGKILGVSYLLLTQLVLYGIAGGIIAVVGQKMAITKMVFSYLTALTPGFWFFTLAFVIISTASYLILAAIAASLVNDQSQISQAMTPVTLIAMVPYIVAISSSSAGAGNNAFIQVLSYIPLMGQSIMPSQLANHYATWWQASLSLVLAVLFFAFLLHFGLKLYKKNVLSYSEENISKQLLASFLPEKWLKRKK
ncbi:ABC transporter permease [Fructobacillus sp. CRL 2054]|uniref:ABC transporter permease n=1 Tax=Fructobacillus sp. CRL 2054 TaxID=2763007 RepID=UPI002378BAF8|nr:ABC transporter permease [Fructobacillus sp. CRL 2054]MDD9138596.1 ABC transporter permease [Fructobacillus sp. CRL 2054]